MKFKIEKAELIYGVYVYVYVCIRTGYLWKLSLRNNRKGMGRFSGLMVVF